MDETSIRETLAPFRLGKILDGVHVKDGMVQVALAIRREEVAQLEPLRREIEVKLAALPGVKNAAVVFTAHREVPVVAKPAETVLPGVKHVVAVASGKGGVGKSTVAVNLAVAMAQTGLTVGLLDADIYGPSMPRMLGLTARPETRDGKMLPLHAWGVSCMSIGFLVEEETAMVWRGPMVMGAITQLLGQVEWGVLDVLVIDMPPGTGDTQLTLAQKANLAGAVVVSTPQDIALIDARRGVKMFEQVRVPVLGIVENMSFFACPHCGERTDIFGHGGARDEAARIGVRFLGEVPLLLAIRETGDGGTPITAAKPESAAAAAFRAIAAEVLESLRAGRVAGPAISYDYMPEIGFYHLTRTGVEAALPALLGRTLAAGEKAVVLCGSGVRVATLDAALWLVPEWLPHGTVAAPHPEWQPVFLTEAADNPAGAKFLFLVDGGEADLSTFARVFDLFDGNDEAAVVAARARWTAAKAAGFGLTYWKQGEKGWEKVG
jgi:ATP-binding protein involved in chromosome partitioning